jgi:putative methionine-R-sulfoxide reductase with GAF domain
MSRITPDRVVGADAGHGPPTGSGSFVHWRRVLEWALIPLAFVITRFVPGRPDGVGEWLVLVAAGLLFASPAIFASYREYVKGRLASSAEDLAIEYRTRLGLTLGEAVIPIGDLLGRISTVSAAERPGLLGQLRQRVVDAAAALANPGRTRAVFYRLEGRTLRVAAWAGRPDPPSATLARSEPGPAVAYELVEQRVRLLVPDVRHEDAVDLGLGGEYVTCLAVAVSAGVKRFGILVLDAPAPGVLEEADTDVAAALAQMLAAGLALE